MLQNHTGEIKNDGRDCPSKDNVVADVRSREITKINDINT